MQTITLFLVIMLAFAVGIFIGYYIWDQSNPSAGILDIDDSNPDHIHWTFNLNTKFSPEEISKKETVKFYVHHVGGKQL